MSSCTPFCGILYRTCSLYCASYSYRVFSLLFSMPHLASCLALVSHLLFTLASYLAPRIIMCYFAPRSFRLSPVEFFKVHVILLSTVVLISYTEFLDSNILTGNVYNILNLLPFTFIEKYTFQLIIIDLLSEYIRL